MDSGDGAEALDLLAEREAHLCLVERGETAVGPGAGYEQPSGVRPHIDDPDPHLHAS
jgi:hypothetical protein